MILNGHGAAGEAGFTLMEMLVALVLFALISMAGVTLVDTVLGVQQRIDGRSDRLAELQRATFIITADLEQVVEGPVSNMTGIRFERASASGSFPVAYRFADGTLYRASGRDEYPLITGVGAVAWRFLHDDTWSANSVAPPAAPIPPRAVTNEAVTAVPLVETAEAPKRPQAVELTVTLAPVGRGPRGNIRRVMELAPTP